MFYGAKGLGFGAVSTYIAIMSDIVLLFGLYFSQKFPYGPAAWRTISGDLNSQMYAICLTCI